MASSLKVLALMAAASKAAGLSMQTLRSLKYILMDSSCMGTNNLPVWNRGELGVKNIVWNLPPVNCNAKFFMASTPLF